LIPESMPLIKETRVDKLIASLKCIANNAFDRYQQRDCILQLYPGKSEKSVFRGMIVTSLRHMGLILGYEGALRISANARIIIESNCMESELKMACLRAVMYEIDQTKFNLIGKLTDSGVTTQDLISLLASSQRLQPARMKERVLSWLSILNQVKLIDNVLPKVIANKNNIDQTNHILDASRIDQNLFTSTLFEQYNRLGRNTAGIVDITDLRSEVSSIFLNRNSIILSENMFDIVLRSVPISTPSYLISFGRSMGAEEKLFRIQQNYYRTISINFFKGMTI